MSMFDIRENTKSMFALPRDANMAPGLVHLSQILMRLMATTVKHLLHDKRLAGRSLPYQSQLNALLHASPNSPIDLHAPEMPRGHWLAVGRPAGNEAV
jgi:hypothetical protein